MNTLRWAARHIPLVILFLAFISLGACAYLLGWQMLWATPDQRGAWQLARGNNAQAADDFLDPVWRGIALMRNGQFKEAADSFAQSDSPAARYDRGNALIMLGQYPDAVAQYDSALTLRPGWPDAIANRNLAVLRTKLANPQGETEDTMLAPADEAYNPNRQRNGEPPDEDAQTGMSNEAVRALWLLRVQTTPGDFLRARFSYQLNHASPDASQ